MPITAIGSRDAFSRAAMRCCAFSNAMNARLSGDRAGSRAESRGDDVRASFAPQPFEQQKLDFRIAHFCDRGEPIAAGASSAAMTASVGLSSGKGSRSDRSRASRLSGGRTSGSPVAVVRGRARGRARSSVAPP